MVTGRDVSISVALGRRLLFSHEGDTARTPASNQKLLLSMALLDVFAAGSRVATVVSARTEGRAIPVDVYVSSGGDPTFGDAGYRAMLGLEGSTIDLLARQIVAGGIRRIEGSVVGTPGRMRGDWDAPGWQPYVPQTYITKPTALSYNGNVAATPKPELQVATRLTQRLEELGVDVGGRARMDIRRSQAKVTLASVASPSLIEQIEIMSRDSSNFIAEVLSKRLGARCLGSLGTITKGARTIRRWARAQGVDVVAHDASGLSYDDRVSTDSLVTLMERARRQPWGGRLLRALAEPGQGTLSGRLAGVRVHAKTGSLFNGTSALSGWVWLEQKRRWAAFSILSSLGGAGPALEDEIVRLLATTATD
jgi:D-alanyl-D-alanine carboxypeptidase